MSLAVQYLSFVDFVKLKKTIFFLPLAASLDGEEGSQRGRDEFIMPVVVRGWGWSSSAEGSSRCFLWGLRSDLYRAVRW